MKQHVTEEQLEELSIEAKRNLSNWCASRGYFSPGAKIIGREMNVVFALDESPTLSIGQMIELLGNGWWKNLFTWNYGSVDCEYEDENKELCDALWEEVKKKL